MTDVLPRVATDAFPAPQSSYTRDDLLACARGEMFGPGNAQLPAPPMLMMDRIVEITRDGGAYGRGFMQAELDITPEQWFFLCHFFGDPVMPCGSWWASTSAGRAPRAGAGLSASAR